MYFLNVSKRFRHSIKVRLLISRCIPRGNGSSTQGGANLSSAARALTLVAVWERLTETARSLCLETAMGRFRFSLFSPLIFANFEKLRKYKTKCEPQLLILKCIVSFSSEGSFSFKDENVVLFA